MKRLLSFAAVLILMVSLVAPVYAAGARGSYIGDDIMAPYDFTTLCDAIDHNIDKIYYPCEDENRDHQIDDIANA